MIPACILAIENDADREYMTWLFVQYEKLMYATIYKILGSPWNTEDTLQSCIEKLIDKIETLKKFDEKQLHPTLLLFPDTMSANHFLRKRSASRRRQGNSYSG